MTNRERIIKGLNNNDRDVLLDLKWGLNFFTCEGEESFDFLSCKKRRKTCTECIIKWLDSEVKDNDIIKISI